MSLISRKNVANLMAVVGISSILSASAIADVSVEEKMAFIRSLDSQKYLTIETSRIDEIGEDELFNSTVPLIIEDIAVSSKKKGDSTNPPIVAPTPQTVDIDQIVNLGKQIWDVILANKPVVDIQADNASAVPEGTTHWTQLEGWQAPKARLFRLSFSNVYGISVVDLTFRLVYTYGGSVDGKGQFLSNVTIVPAQISVAWGYKLNAKASVPSVTNAGSRKNPIGTAELLLSWSVDTVLRHIQGSSSYYVRGDGSFLDLSEGNLFN